MAKARSTFTHLCGECRSSNTTDNGSGDIVCTDCGRVITRVIDQGEEQRTFADDPGPQKKRAEELPTADKRLLEAFKRLRFMAERIDIPHAIRGRAEEIYKQLYETKQLDGRIREGVLAASLFIACRQQQMPRTFKDIGCTVDRSKCPNKVRNSSRNFKGISLDLD